MMAVRCYAYTAHILIEQNKKTQLLLEKTCYILYSFCCSSDLQDHLRSMIAVISEKAYATAY